MVRNVSLKDEWHGGDYELYDWRCENEDGDEITDGTILEDGMKVYPRSNYVKFEWDQDRPTHLIGYTGGKPSGKIILPTKTTRIANEVFKECEELTALDCRGCGVTYVYLRETAISSIDLSQCTNVKWIYFEGGTKLESVDLTECRFLRTIGHDAFTDCIKATVKLGANVRIVDVDSGAFGNNENSWCKKVLVPSYARSLL